MTFGVICARRIPRYLAMILDQIGIDKSADIDLESLSVDDRKKIIEGLYRVLDVVDNKTSHLLRFFSILLAIILATVGYYVNQVTTGSASLSSLEPAHLWVFIPSGIALLSVFVGIGTSLRVFRIKWAFLQRKKYIDGTVKANRSFADEICAISQLCDKRSGRFAFLWFFSLCAVVFVATSVLIIIFQTIPINFPITEFFDLVRAGLQSA